jgi:hypothetical protein
MFDTILTLPLELMTLTLLVGFGLLHSYRRRRPATIAVSTARTFDMRLDGQRLSA